MYLHPFRTAIQFATEKKHSGRISIVLALILTISGSLAAHAAPGDLDPTFGNGGIVITEAGGVIESAHAIAIQSDRKIVIAGFTRLGSFNDFLLARYNANGSLDTTFGTNGMVITSITNDHDVANAVAIQSDGKIVAAGYSLNQGCSLARYMPNGTLDSAFGTDGKVIITIGTSGCFINDMAILPDGKIIIAGSAFLNNVDIALAKLNINGTLDSTFGDGGKVVTDIEGVTDRANGVSIQADGKIVIAGISQGSEGGKFTLARYNTDGSLDNSFGNGGTVTTVLRFSDAANDLAIQPDGKIVAAGSSYDGAVAGFALVRYNTNGSLDSSFGTNGTVITTIGSLSTAQDVAIQTNGKIVAAGRSQLPGAFSDFTLTRYNANGSPDTSFGTNGVVVTPVSSSLDTADAVTIQADGKIIASGGSFSNPNNRDLALVRYTGDSIAQRSTYFDFDGDSKADYSVFRNGEWLVNKSSGGFLGAFWGASTDQLTPGDFDGDRKTDFAVYRSTATGGTNFYVIKSTTLTYQGANWGTTGDIARIGDFDDDGKDDLSVYRPSTATFYALPTAGGATIIQQIGQNGDFPIALNYDSDNKTDLATFRESSGVWTIRQSANNQTVQVQFGASGDKPVPADYDNDGKADIAVFRNGNWFVLRSTNSQVMNINWGIGTDTPVPADYDGDGQADYAVFRAGQWYVLRSSQGITSAAWGQTGDRPIPAAFIP